VALLSTILATVGVVRQTPGGAVANLGAYHLAFGAAAVIALIGATIALTIKDSDAAPSMRKPDAGVEAGEADEAAQAFERGAAAEPSRP
jgi:hypothetical protein